MERIKKVLNSEAGLLIENANNVSAKTIVDNRFELLKQSVDSVENKNDNFYCELIRLISDYLDKLYDSKIDDFPKTVFDKNGELIPQNYDYLSSGDIFKLRRANRDLAINLFEYVCAILEQNENIKLDRETLTKLLNRNPQLLSISVEESYLNRAFDFKKLAETINKNQTLKKSNISVDDIYQLLIDTCQIDNNNVFRLLISSKDFQENHQKLQELLTKCNGRTFVAITNIIIRNLDKNFDRLSIAKERKDNGFYEEVIISLLKSYSVEEDYNFIHMLLTDESISIDYNFDWADYFGQTSLKEIIAFSQNPTIIKDLLSKQENIQNTYWYGEAKVQLYRLYAIVGEYEKALALFQQNYNYAHDFTESFYSGFNKDGYAHGDMTYKDSLVAFIENICNSFKDKEIEYSYKRDLISRILNSENVKYINLEDILPLLQEVLTDEDFLLLLDALTEKYSDGRLGFINVDEQDEIFARYIIKISSYEEIQNILSTFNKRMGSKSLCLKNQFNSKKDDQ